MHDEDLHIAHQIRVVDHLKAELVQALASLFQGMLDSKEDQVLDSLATLVLTNYVLARRLGLPLHRLEEEILGKIRDHQNNGNWIESRYQDFSILAEFLARE